MTLVSYLTKATALHHSRQISQIETTMMCFAVPLAFSFLDFKINFNS